jgi:hypothetical protein
MSNQTGRNFSKVHSNIPAGKLYVKKNGWFLPVSPSAQQAISCDLLFIFWGTVRPEGVKEGER